MAEIYALILLFIAERAMHCRFLGFYFDSFWFFRFISFRMPDIMAWTAGSWWAAPVIHIDLAAAADYSSSLLRMRVLWFKMLILGARSHEMFKNAWRISDSI